VCFSGGAPTIEIYVLALSTVFSVFCLSLSLISLSFLLIKWISRPALINIKFIFTPPCTCSNNVRRLWVHYPLCRWPRPKCLQFSRFKVTFEPKVQCRHGPDDLVKKKKKRKAHTFSPKWISMFACSFRDLAINLELLTWRRWSQNVGQPTIYNILI